MPAITAFNGLVPCSARWMNQSQFASRTQTCFPNVSLNHRWVLKRRPQPLRQPALAQASATPSRALDEDTLVQFQNSAGVRRLARVIKPDGKRNWIVHDSNGVSHSITAKQVTFILGPEAIVASPPEDLNKLNDLCQEKADENRDWLQLVWEVVSTGGGIDETNVTDVTSIAEIIFSDDAPLSLYATHLLLSDDRLYFKARSVKGQVLYEARPEAQVKEAKLMQEAEILRESQVQARREAFLKAYADRSLAPLKAVLGDPEVESLLRALKEMAIELEGRAKVDARYQPSVGNAFQLLDKRGKDLVIEATSVLGKKALSSVAMDLLVAWRVLTRHENLALLKADIPHLTAMDDKLSYHVDELFSNVPEDVDVERRRDLTHLTAYAIDSANTTEVDDAIAWDPDTNRVLVHVADPTRYFPGGPAHPILREVFRRVSTLYLPYDKFTMFPDDLATRLLSLDGVESDGSALTFGFCVAEDGSLVEDSVVIQPTRISPPLRMTYEEAENLLSQPPGDEDHKNLQTLYSNASARKHWRETEGGAIIISSPFTEISVHHIDRDDPEITVEVVRTDTKSWTVVSELMIMACTLAADIAEKAEIPVPFRGQQPFDYPTDDVLESVPDGPVRAAMAFRNAPPSQVSTKPMEHASLGLDSYVQITSPIRRTADLVAHFQIKAYLRGEDCPFSVEEVKQEIGRSNDVMRTLRTVENRTKKYWQLEYLRRLGSESEHDGIYVRQLKEADNRLALVHLEKYGFPVAAAVPSSSKPGSKLRVRVQEANPRTGALRTDAVLAIPDAKKDGLAAILNDAFSDVSSQSELA